MHCFADACLVEISEELCMRELMMLIVTEMKNCGIQPGS